MLLTVRFQVLALVILFLFGCSRQSQTYFSKNTGLDGSAETSEHIFHLSLNVEGWDGTLRFDPVAEGTFAYLDTPAGRILNINYTVGDSLKAEEYYQCTLTLYQAESSDEPTKIFSFETSNQSGAIQIDTLDLKKSDATYHLVLQCTDEFGSGIENLTAIQFHIGPLLQGDLNFSGCVDISDVQVIAAHWNDACNALGTCHYRGGDVNRDGHIDISDIQVIASNYLNGCKVTKPK